MRRCNSSCEISKPGRESFVFPNHAASVNIFEDPEVREGLKSYSNWPTFPQLYVGGELIGGCDIALELHKSGELKDIVAKAGSSATAAAE